MTQTQLSAAIAEFLRTIGLLQERCANLAAENIALREELEKLKPKEG